MVKIRNKEHEQVIKITNVQNFLNNISLVKQRDADFENIYYHDNVNSYGHRGIDFKLTDALILGCSQTFGYSLPYEHTWARIVCDRLGLSYSNLSFPGSSLQSQVIESFRYFKEYGNPKVIFAVMPFSRIEMPFVDNHVYYNGLMKLNRTEDAFGIDVLDLSAQLKGLVEPDSFAKSPFNFDKIVPIEFVCYYNEIFILMLEQYCESNNIKLYWTYWECTNDSFQNNVMKNHKNFFIFPAESLFKKEYIYKDNHYTERHNELKNNDLFYIAQDKKHWGIYQNLCMSDYIESKYNNG